MRVFNEQDDWFHTRARELQAWEGGPGKPAPSIGYSPTELAGEHRAADDASVVCQLRSANHHVLEGAFEGAIQCGLLDDGHHLVLERFDNTAAEDNDFGIEDVHQIRDSNTSVPRGVVHNFFDELIAATDRAPQVAAAHVIELFAQQFSEHGLFARFHRILDFFKDRGAAGESFKASVVAAAT